MVPMYTVVRSKDKPTKFNTLGSYGSLPEAYKAVDTLHSPVDYVIWVI